jgi:hypothetical protein
MIAEAYRLVSETFGIHFTKRWLVSRWREIPNLVQGFSRSNYWPKIFTPFVFISLAIFLGAIFATKKDPFTDREFLVVFNALLIGVMAIILFSISEASKGRNNKINSEF